MLLAAGNGAAAGDRLQSKIWGCSAVGPSQGPGDGDTDPEFSPFSIIAFSPLSARNSLPATPLVYPKQGRADERFHSRAVRWN